MESKPGWSRCRKRDSDHPRGREYVYDPAGNLLATRYRNGVETTNTFNTRNQLRRMRTTKGTGSNPPQWANFDYDGTGELAAPGNDASWGTSVLSKSGQRNRMEENINAVLRQVDYTYDKRQRLTLKTIGSGSISFAGNGGTLSEDPAQTARVKITMLDGRVVYEAR